jgi:hypothetical protein
MLLIGFQGLKALLHHFISFFFLSFVNKDIISEFDYECLIVYNI